MSKIELDISCKSFRDIINWSIDITNTITDITI